MTVPVKPLSAVTVTVDITDVVTAIGFEDVVLMLKSVTVNVATLK